MKQLKIGIVLQYFQMIGSALISILVTPLVLNMLGASEYGLYNLSSSIISYLSLLTLGLGSSYMRFFAMQKEEDEKKLGGLNALYLLVFVIIGAVALILGFLLSRNVGLFLNDTYSAREHAIARTLFLLLTFNLALSFPLSVFTSYITSQERFVYLKIISIAKTIVSPAVSVVVLYFGYGSVGLVAVTILLSVVIDILNVYYSIKKLKMPISFRNVEFKKLKSIFLFSAFIVINNLVDQLNWQADKVILGKIINAEAVALYGIGAMLNGLYVTVSSTISNVFAPRIHAIVAEKRDDYKNKLTTLMIDVGSLQFVILSLILTGFLFFGKQFIALWVGEEYRQAYVVALLLMAPATIALVQNAGIEIQRAMNMHRFRSIAYLIIAIINVAVSIVLCYYWGIVGVTIGTSISLIVGNGFLINWYYHFKMGLNMKRFWQEITKMIPAVIPACVVGCFFWNRKLPNYISLFGAIVLYTAVFCISVYLLVYRRGGLKMLKRGEEEGNLWN